MTEVQSIPLTENLIKEDSDIPKDDLNINNELGNDKDPTIPTPDEPNLNKRSRDAEFEPPAAQIVRIVKDVLPKGVQLTKDARAAFQKAAGIFIHYLTTASNDICNENKRSTIYPNDVLVALKDLEFHDFIAPVERVLEKLKNEHEINKKRKKDAAAALEADGNDGGDGIGDDIITDENNINNHDDDDNNHNTQENSNNNNDDDDDDDNNNNDIDNNNITDDNIIQDTLPTTLDIEDNDDNNDTNNDTNSNTQDDDNNNDEMDLKAFQSEFETQESMQE